MTDDVSTWPAHEQTPGRVLANIEVGAGNDGADAWSGANTASSPARLSTVWSMSCAPSPSSTANAAPLASPGQPTSRCGDTVMVSVIPRMSR